MRFGHNHIKNLSELFKLGFAKIFFQGKHRLGYYFQFLMGTIRKDIACRPLEDLL
jgi:hypothetical protein